MLARLGCVQTTTHRTVSDDCLGYGRVLNNAVNNLDHAFNHTMWSSIRNVHGS